MKTFFSFLILALFHATGAHAGTVGIPEGSYQGRMVGQEKGKVHLLVQNNAGCDGCFTAVAIDTPDFRSPTVRMVAYTGMPWDSTLRKFSLTPIAVNSNGDLTHPDDNPSLMLDITSSPGTGEVEFVITPSGIDNPIGFTTSMTFHRHLDSPFDFAIPEAGRYKYYHQHKTNATISGIQQNSQDQALDVSMQWFGSIRHRGGNYNLKEKFPGVFSFNSVVYASTGKTIADMPSYIVIFAKRRGRNYILMVNPKDSRDVLCLVQK